MLNHNQDKQTVFRTIATLFITCLLLVGCNSEQKNTDASHSSSTLPTLYFSAIPDQNTTELTSKFSAIASHLESKLGVPVKYIPSTNYAASVEMFRNGDIQLAWFGGLTGVQARHSVKGAVAIAQGISDPNYLSYFIAHSSVDIDKSDDFPMTIKSLPFAFGSAQSTSGRLMPEYFIKQRTGKSPKDFFDQLTVFSGSHDKTLDLVRSGGAIKTGVLSFKVYEKHLKRDPNLEQSVKIIWVTPSYSDYNFTAHPILNQRYGEGFINKLQQVLIDIKDPALLSAFPRTGLIKASNDEYQSIEEIARAQGFIR